MPNQNNQIILILNLSHTGYRRAGTDFQKGENRFDGDDFTKEQLAMLEADPRLEVQTLDSSSEVDQGHGDGKHLAAGINVGTIGQVAHQQVDRETTLPSETNEPVTLALSLVDAIGQLDPSNNEHFTKSGKPTTEALSKLMDAPVTGDQRNTAWDEFKASRNQE